MGWRAEGVGAMKSFLCLRFRPLFCTLCAYLLLRRRGHNSGETSLAFILNPVGRQLPPANSISEPLRQKQAIQWTEIKLEQGKEAIPHPPTKAPAKELYSRPPAASLQDLRCLESRFTVRSDSNRNTESLATSNP